MRILSSNEWDPLKSIIVGSATNANWPVNCPDFRKLEQTTKWKETPLPSGPVHEQIISEANEDLKYLADFLTSCGINVLRPRDIDFQDKDGFYNYCPRDRLLVVDTQIIDAPMVHACRQMEIEAYDFLDHFYVKPLGRWDAANVCRLNDDLLYLISDSGDMEGYNWLKDYFSLSKQVHAVTCYGGVHIDSTISPVREGLVVLNGNRINEDNMPEPFKKWDKIYIHECEHQDFINYPYASNWIGINFLVVDPSSIVCDPKQENLRRQLDKYSVDSHGINLRHSRTLGGGHHCVTLDLHRE
jgi:scyllo-inosamine-4-phosphate amidinotransferase 1